MIKLKVTPQKLRDVANIFDTQQNNVVGSAHQMLVIVFEMSHIWEGDAANAYYRKFEELQDDIERVNKIVREQIDDLKNIAGIYERAEQTASAKSSGLPTNPIPG